jgi:hypothetical protein
MRTRPYDPARAGSGAPRCAQGDPRVAVRPEIDDGGVRARERGIGRVPRGALILPDTRLRAHLDDGLESRDWERRPRRGWRKRRDRCELTAPAASLASRDKTNAILHFAC